MRPRPSTRRSPPPRTPRRRTRSTSRNLPRPSSPRADAQAALNGLFLVYGRCALVGAVGVANIMGISALERRSEIGLRRALGATRGHIRTQFLSEAILLSLFGGAAAFCSVRSRPRSTPRVNIGSCPSARLPGEGSARRVVIGAVAGLWACTARRSISACRRPKHCGACDRSGEHVRARRRLLRRAAPETRFGVASRTALRFAPLAAVLGSVVSFIGLRVALIQVPYLNDEAMAQEMVAFALDQIPSGHSQPTRGSPI